jgi:hypothetical protein
MASPTNPLETTFGNILLFSRSIFVRQICERDEGHGDGKCPNLGNEIRFFNLIFFRGFLPLFFTGT